MRHITKVEAEPFLNWPDMVRALKQGHLLSAPKLSDQFLHRGGDTLLSRAAWIDGLGAGVKTVTVIPENTTRGLPSIHGVMTLFEDRQGAPVATLESDLITKWKTAADSVLGAQLLAKEAPKVLAIIGNGQVAASLIDAYPAVFPSLERIYIWGRNADKVSAFVKTQKSECELIACANIEQAVADADIVSTATMSKEPILDGSWVKAGAHIDLIGAFKPDMREASDDLLTKSRLFVDCRQTTIGHIGELMIPLAQGVLVESDILGDYYDLIKGGVGRQDKDDITILKNGGGAHLDVMCAHAVLQAMDRKSNH